MTVAVVAVATVCGLLLGGGARWLLSTLRRGAVIRPGVLEVATAAISGSGVYLAYPAGNGLWILVFWAGLLAVTLSAVDLKHHRLPDAITLPAIGGTAGLVLVAHALSPHSGSVVRALGAGAALGAIFFGLAAAAPRSMGRGDAKLAVTIGLLLGYVSWPAVVVGVGLAFVIGAATALLGMAAGRVGLKSAIPFGPSLLAACWLLLVFPSVLAR